MTETNYRGIVTELELGNGTATRIGRNMESSDDGVQGMEVYRVGSSLDYTEREVPTETAKDADKLKDELEPRTIDWSADELDRLY